MATSRITATYNATSQTWSWSGNDSPSGSHTYDANGATRFIVNVLTTNVPSGTTIVLLPDGIGNGNMVEFEGFTGSPICMSNFTRVSNTRFTFRDNNPSITENNVYLMRIGLAVTSGETTTNTYSPDPIIINKDPDGTMRVTLPKPHLTAAQS